VLVPAFEAILQTKPAAYWLSLFDAAGIPAEPINTLPEILDHPQVAGRGMLIEIEYPPGSGNRIRTAGMPWCAVAADRPVLSPPGLGQHTEEVLSELRKRNA
jgi:crotonobetainyl-CoA:carnitine CoA-transferase CaiB-like acyl-CoA transferase